MTTVARTQSELVDEARMNKARTLTALLEAAGIGAVDAAVLNDEQRHIIARSAAVRYPSETTWTLVLGLLVQHEADSLFEPDGPFDLCPDCQEGNPRTNTPCTDCARETHLELVADRRG